MNIGKVSSEGALHRDPSPEGAVAKPVGWCLQALGRRPGANRGCRRREERLWDGAGLPALPALGSLGRPRGKGWTEPCPEGRVDEASVMALKRPGDEAGARKGLRSEFRLIRASMEGQVWGGGS